MRRNNRPSALMIFLDGLGVGPRDRHNNPLADFDPEILSVFSDENDLLPKGGRLIPTDATLGVEGLPQSATGQTALFTGINAARYIGRHLQGYPSQPLRRLIARHSLFHDLIQRNLRVSFANTYTPRFFEKRPRWVSVTTVMCETSGVDFWRLEDLIRGDSIFMDFSNRCLRKRGYEVPLWTPKQAAEILTRQSRSFDFCLYEFFLTDLVGHRGSWDEAVKLLRELDAFLAHVLGEWDTKRNSLIVTSDHGNIEDMSSRQHTRNPVPTMIWGPLAEDLPADSPGFSLINIKPMIVKFLGG